MFEETFTHISSADMFTILKLNISREFQMLQFLFFSTLSDYKKDHLNIKLFDIKSEYKNHSYVQMKRIINLNVQKRILTYHIRKNEFFV